MHKPGDKQAVRTNAPDWLMRRIPRWLAPPVFEGDEEKTRHASLIHMIVVSSLAFALLVMIGALLGGKTPASTLIIDLVASALMLLFLRWIRGGRIVLARIGMVVFGLVYITGVTASIGTIRTPTASIFLFWLLMTGMLFGLRGIAIGTGAASLAVLGLILAENAGWLRQPYYGVGVTQWITFTALFGCTGGLTYYISQGAQRALALAKQEIEHRKQAELALSKSQQQYEKLVSKIPFGTYILRSRPDHSFALDYVSPRALEFFNADRETLLSDPIAWTAAIHPDDRDSFIELNQQGIERLKAFDWSGRIQSLGQFKFLRIESTPDPQENGDVLWHGTIEDITERKQTEEIVRQLAYFDPLTGLANRLLLGERLTQVMLSGQRSGRYGAALFIDLDNFKPVNDLHGHEVGDVLLVEVAKRLKSLVRQVDTVARFGGDEFVVLLHDLPTDKTQAHHQVQLLAEEIRRLLATPYALPLTADGTHPTRSVEHRCTASIGVMLFLGFANTEGEVIKWADIAMYHAKDAGGDLVRLYEVNGPH